MIEKDVESMEYTITVTFKNGWSEVEKVHSGTSEYDTFQQVTKQIQEQYAKKGKKVILVDYHNASHSFYFEELREDKW